MDFATAWAELELGVVVTVSDGTPAPMALPDSLPMRLWRSHNFEGELVEKIDGMPRQLRFDLPANGNGNQIGYAVAEGHGHNFDVA